MQAKTPMVFVLRDGETLHGVIEWYDRCCLKVNRSEGPNILLYKPAIKYMYRDSYPTSLSAVSASPGGTPAALRLAGTAGFHLPFRELRAAPPWPSPPGRPPQKSGRPNRCAN